MSVISNMFIEEIWNRLELLFKKQSIKVMAYCKDCKLFVERDANDASRGISFMKDPQNGDAVDIWVDVFCGDGFCMGADITIEGIIIADGPLLYLAGELSEEVVQDQLDQWFLAFEKVLDDNALKIEAAIMALE